MTGHLFGDRYQVGDTLGFGGMSEVHRGRDLRLGRDVAIKVLRADLARDPSFQARFRREAQNAASLNHPAIVAVYDTGETPGETGPIPYIVMEFVDGETLRDLLKREGSLTPRRAMEIVADVCAALDFSHRHGIVHRDIKPANVMLTRAGAVKVMDFGIARAVADGQNSMTATAAVIGTAQYLSPEQARGEAVDARSDVYATGCVLFELLTGAPPFTGDSPVAVAYQHVREDPKAPSQVKPGLPRELDAIVLKALNKNPLNRYQTAAEMRSDLVRALSGQAVHATPVMSDEERTQLLRPGPMRVGAATGAAAGTPPLLAPPRRSLPEDSWAEEEPDKSGKKVWGYVGVGVLCAALLAAGIFFTLRFLSTESGPETVAAPRVTDMTQEQAIRTLQDQGLEPGDITEIASTDEMKGKVTSQNPSENTRVDVGSKVNLQVGAGVSQVDVPDVMGMEAPEASRVLQDLGLVMQEQTRASPDADQNKAIEQDPAPPTQLTPGSTVTVVFGSGLEKVAVPGGLTGIPYDQAAAALTQAKLQPVRQDVDSVLPVDQVVALGDGIAEGQTVVAGTPIPLQVSNNTLFEVPNLLQKSPDEAIASLVALGWQGSNLPVIATVQTTNGTMIGRIMAGQGNCANGQNPAAGSQVSKTSVISVCIGEAARLTVPSVVGQQRDAAIAAITGAGFRSPAVIDAGPAPAGKGNTVAGIDPGAGNVVPFNTQITISVYQAEAAPSSSPAAPVVPPAGNAPPGG